MSALFGFCGAQDEKCFTQMRDALSHRGDASHKSVDHRLSLGYWESQWAAGVSSLGLYRGDQGVLALSGFQTLGPDSRHLPLEEIATSLNKNQLPPSGLTGDFVIAFLAADGRFFLVRDGSGARTVYFASWRDRFFFASEPKAIWSMSGFPRRLDPNSLAKYLTYSFVPGEETMLEGVHELLPGHCLVRQTDGELKHQRYFQFEEVQNDPAARISAEEAPARFREVFAHSVSDRLSLVGNQSPVVFLSGGLDSSVVAAELTRQSTVRVRTYSLHFGRRYPNELEYAQLVAKQLGTDHQEILIQPKDFVGDLHEMVWHLDDPIGDPITMPNFELARRVAGDTEFVFNGEGGDPCFGGPKNIPMLLQHWYGQEQKPEQDSREKAYLASYRRAYEEIDHIFTPEFARELDENCLVRLLTPFFTSENPKNYLDKLTAINIRLKGAHLILPKVERMLGASGLLPLSPLFSEDMVRFSFQIPSVLKLHRGSEKFVIKEAYRRMLPAAVIERRKSGMRVPVHFWFQGELKRYAKKLLSPREIARAGIFRPQRVKQLLNYSIEEGNGRYGMRLWMLLTFEIWRRRVIEQRE